MQTLMMLLGLWTGPINYWKVNTTEAFSCKPKSNTVREVVIIDTWRLASEEIEGFPGAKVLYGHTAILIYMKGHKIPYAFGSHYNDEPIIQKAQK